MYSTRPRPYPLCLKDDSKPCHRAQLVTNWKFQNKTRTLTLPTQSQDMSPIENLWNNLGDSQETSDNQTQVDRVAHRSLEPESHPVSTGIRPQSLPEWAFRARPGIWRICLCPKVARIAEQKQALIQHTCIAHRV